MLLGFVVNIYGLWMHTMSISVGIKLDRGDDLINIIHQTQVNVINEFGLVV